MTEIKDIVQSVDIVEVVARYVDLKKQGAEYLASCPFHDENTPSFTVSPAKQIFKCFGCDEVGDALDFIKMYVGLETPAAIKELQSFSGLTGDEIVKKPKKENKKNSWTQIFENIPPATVEVMKHYKRGVPKTTWTYHDITGNPIAYVCRFESEEGKIVLPFTYRTDGSTSKWMYKGFDPPRPLWNLHNLVANPKLLVIMVEGEKAAKHLSDVLPGDKCIVTTWHGGGNSIRYVDLKPLHGRRIVFWPDNDTQGLSVMLHIIDLIGPTLKMSRILPLDTTKLKGWDCADQDWDSQGVMNYVNDMAVESIPENSDDKNAVKAWKFAQVGDPNVQVVFGRFKNRKEWRYKEMTIPQLNGDPNDPKISPYQPFRFLGFNKSEGAQRFHFFAKNSSVLISLSPGKITKHNLLQLGSLQWWEERFPAKMGFDVDAAANFIVSTSNKVGPFTERNLRGRGAWIDEDRVVIHNGPSLIVDDESLSLQNFKSEYIYEIGYPLGFGAGKPLEKRQAYQLLEILDLLNWERVVNSQLLAGWCVVAPICGALDWRPHVWITGSAGTGKSWLMLNIIRRILGDTCVAVQGDTTEAGLRALLQHDALPVVFDEAEGDKKAQDRMQSVLSLMRAASADDGGIMAKGSSGGGVAKTYRIRSCFAFASIVMQLAQQADRSRVTVLGLQRAKGPEADARWAKLQEMHYRVMTDEWVAGLHARTIKLLPTILKNARTFAAAAAVEIGEQRAGDQLGFLLAGAYSLVSDGEVDLKFAKKWVSEKDWSEERGLDETRDEIALIQYLMNLEVNVEAGEHVRVNRTIGELLMLATKKVDTGPVDSKAADMVLARCGFRWDLFPHRVIVSNSSSWIKKNLFHTNWSKNHHKLLERIEDAVSKKSVRFGSGITTRAVEIPFDSVFLEESND